MGKKGGLLGKKAWKEEGTEEGSKDGWEEREEGLLGKRGWKEEWKKGGWYGRRGRRE